MTHSPALLRAARSAIVVLLGGALAACGDNAFGPTVGTGGKAEAVEHFLTIAFDAESDTSTARVVRWGNNLRLAANLYPTASDSIALEEAAAELTSLLPNGPTLSVVRFEPNVEVYFMSRVEFDLFFPDNDCGASASGCAIIYFGSTHVIVRGVIWVSTDVSPDLRRRIILHEVTHVLGFMGHATRTESILYPSSTAEQLAPIDRMVVPWLYRPELSPGMTKSEARAVVRSF